MLPVFLNYFLRSLITRFSQHNLSFIIIQPNPYTSAFISHKVLINNQQSHTISSIIGIIQKQIIVTVCYCHLTLEVMVFITCNQRTGLLLFTRQAAFTPFAMHGIVGEVNKNILLVQIMLYQKWSHAIIQWMRININCATGQYFGK